MLRLNGETRRLWKHWLTRDKLHKNYHDITSITSIISFKLLASRYEQELFINCVDKLRTRVD